MCPGAVNVLFLSEPVQATYVRFNWDDNRDYLYEVEVDDLEDNGTPTVTRTPTATATPSSTPTATATASPTATSQPPGDSDPPKLLNFAPIGWVTDTQSVALRSLSHSSTIRYSPARILFLPRVNY